MGLGKDKEVHFATLLRKTQGSKDSMVYENSFIELNEKRMISSRKYRELISKNRVKGLSSSRE